MQNMDEMASSSLIYPSNHKMVSYMVFLYVFSIRFQFQVFDIFRFSLTLLELFLVPLWHQILKVILDALCNK